MAVFNFTVRATDSEGSYSDRQFNITVRNSRVERFMVIDSTDAWTSPDGSIWTQRLGQGGLTCAYGNGFWLIIKNTTWTTLKSTDGINYSQIDPSGLTFLADDGSTTTAVTLDSRAKLKFWNGKFYILTCHNTTLRYDLWASTDGTTWQRKRLFEANINTSGGLVTSFANLPRLEMNDDNGTLFIPFPVASGTSSNQYMVTPTTGYTHGMGWSTNDGVTFTPILNASNSSLIQTRGAAMITRINGVYLAFNTPHNNGNTHVGAWGGGNVGATPSSNANWQKYLYSTDALNWSIGTCSTVPYISANNQLIDVPMSINGKIISTSYANQANESQGTTSNNLVHSTTDLLNWTAATIKQDTAWTTVVGNINRWRKMVFSNGVLLQVPSITSGNDVTTDVNKGQNGFRVSVDGGNTWEVVNTLNYPGGGTLATAKTYTDVAAM